MHITSNIYLKNLYLRYCDNITDMGVSYIDNLLSLDITGCSKITNNGILEMKKNNNLEKLNISETMIDDEGIEAIVKLFPNLKNLNISNINITNISMKYLINLNLLELNLSGTNIDDYGCIWIEKMKNIKILDLNNCHFITKEGIDRVSSIDNLIEINIPCIDLEWKILHCLGIN